MKSQKAGGADECITAFYQKNVILSIDRSQKFRQRKETKYMAKREEVMWRINRICSVVNDETLEQLERIMLAYINGAAVKKGLVRKPGNDNTEKKEVK
jgi:hypothetical protein